MRWFLRNRIGLGRSLLAAFAALWFMVALTPCVMAASTPCHDNPCPHCPTDGAAPQDEAMVMADCLIPNRAQLNATPSATADAAPALLQRLPALGALPDNHRRMRDHLRAVTIPHPSLILQYAVFLI